MITVSIGGRLLPFAKASEAWVTEMLARQGSPNALICVRVDIAHQDVRLSLATPACLVMPEERAPNVREQRIIDAWQRHALHTGSVAPDELIAFLRELDRML